MYDIQKMNIWKKQTQKSNGNDYLNLDISELGLGVRSFNCLKRANCNTVGDVIEVMESEKGLMSIRNLGKTSFIEITDKLEEIKKQCPQVNNNGQTKKTVIKPARQIWDTEIEAFGLSAFSRTRLKNCGINYVKDLYINNLKKDPGWVAVRELFDKIPV